MRWIRSLSVLGLLASIAHVPDALAAGGPSGAPVCTGPAYEAGGLVQALPEAGGALRVFYFDFSTDAADVYLGFMSAGSYFNDILPVLGQPLLQRPGYQGDMHLAEVEPNGCATQAPCHPVVMAYVDAIGTESPLRARRFFDSVEWDVAVSPASHHAAGPLVAPDGGSGAFVAWEDRRGPEQRVYAQHLGGDGSRTWDPAGVRLCTVESVQGDLRILPDAGGGFYAIWTDGRYGRHDLYATHLDASSARSPGWPDTGRVVRAGPGLRQRTTLVADGGGGMYVVWLEALPSEVRMLHLLANSTVPPAWPLEGLSAVSLPQGVTVDLEDAAPDGLGGVVLAMLRSEDPQQQALFTRIGPLATRPPGWPAEGLLGGSSTHRQRSVRLIGHAGSLTGVWEDGFDTASNGDLHGARFEADGTRAAGWDPAGHVIAAGDDYQQNPRIGPDASDGVIVVWDRMSANEPLDSDIYGQTVNARGLLDAPSPARRPGQLGVSLASRNPSSSGFRFELRLPAAGPMHAEILDVLGRRVATIAEGEPAAGAHTLVWAGTQTDGARVAAGLYFLRVRAGGTSAGIPVVVTR